MYCDSNTARLSNDVGVSLKHSMARNCIAYAEDASRLLDLLSKMMART